MTEDPLSREAVAMIGDQLKEIQHTQRLHGMAVARLDERMDRFEERMGRFETKLDRILSKLEELS